MQRIARAEYIFTAEEETNTAASGDCLIHVESPFQRFSQSYATSSSSEGSEMQSQSFSRFHDVIPRAVIRSLAMEVDAAWPSCHAFIHLSGDGAPAISNDAVRLQKSGVELQEEADTGTQV